MECYQQEATESGYTHHHEDLKGIMPSADKASLISGLENSGQEAW